MEFFENSTTVPNTEQQGQNVASSDIMNNSNNNNDPFQSSEIPQMDSTIQSAPLEQVDEAEIQRQQDRMKEENERRQKKEEKINLELQKKNELRSKAVEYINDFENKRKEEIELRKKVNLKNEEDNLSNRKLAKEGKKNPWEIVTDNITLKESEYKGTKDISRMRNVIVARKNDSLPNQ